MIHVRIDQELKAKVTHTLSRMGLSVSDAVRLLLTRIEADQALPFEVRVPNRKTLVLTKTGDPGDVEVMSAL